MSFKTRKTHLFMLAALVISLLLPAAACAAELVLPAGLTVIEPQTFYGSDALDVVTLPEGIEEIGSEAFAESSVREINLPASLTQIADDIFRGSEPQTIITEWGTYAYHWAVANGYVIPETDPALFTYSSPKDNCVTLTGFADKSSYPAELFIPKHSPEGYTITAIDKEAFKGCTALTSLYVPETVTTIGYAAFKGCTSLESLRLCEGLASLSDTTNYNNGVFSGCTSLTSVVIPSTVTKIGNYAFNGCTSLASVTFRDSSEAVMTIGENAFSASGLSGDLVIPAKVGAIKKSAFTGAPIASLVIEAGSSLTAIGEHAFDSCVSLVSAYIPGNVTTISANAFQYCTSLVDLTLSEGLVTVAGTTNYDNGAFSGCYSLPSVVIPSTVETIGNYAFHGCTAMTSVTFRGSDEAVLSIGSNAFSATNLSGELFIPAKVGAIKNYAFDATPIASLVIEAGENLTAIGEYAFRACPRLAAVTIPGNVKTIGINAFRDCTALVSLSLAEGLETLSDTVNYNNGVFTGCTSLTSVVLPSTIIKIGNYAFYGCATLADIRILAAEDAVTIGSKAFTGCAGVPVFADGAIRVWVSGSIVDFTRDQIAAFMEANPQYASFDVIVEDVGEGDAANLMLEDIGAGADVYSFAQDQFSRLVAAGALTSVLPANSGAVASANDASAVSAVTLGGTMYAYPMTADNGYFLYYDKSVVTDPSSLEAIIADCEAAGRKVYFEINSGWYQPAFFFGAGCTLTYFTDAAGKFTSVSCDYASAKGVKALKSMIKLAKSPAFVNGSSANGASDIGAIIDGTWDAHILEPMLGKHYAAAKLPTVDGYQLGGFAGFKMLGVKPQATEKRLDACHALALYLTSEAAQVARFETVGWGPSNLNAQKSEGVKANIALSALAAQLKYSVSQGQYPNDYWALATALGDAVIAGAYDDYTDAQLLDVLTAFEADIRSQIAQ